MMTCFELSTPAAAKSVAHVRGKVAEIAARAGADEQVVDEIRLCVSEATANAVRHGYGEGAGRIDVKVELADDELAVVVRDEGKGFAEAPRGTERGYGLRIIKRLTRRYLISSAPRRGTEVRMIFGLASPHVRTAARS